MDLGLRHKVCVITGASSGIGLETARGLAAEGARLILVARGEERLRAAAEELDAAYLAIDVRAAACDAKVIREADALGGIDVLVNNAGTSYVKGLDELTEEDWQLQYELSVLAPMRLMRAAAPRMAARGWGRIVNVASSAGKRPSLTNPSYSVMKAAQLSLSRVFADTYAAQGVLVNAVTPGATASELWMGRQGMAQQSADARGISREQAVALQEARIPLGRFSKPRELADVVVFLCSERASTVTGAAWSADGGTVNIII